LCGAAGSSWPVAWDRAASKTRGRVVDHDTEPSHHVP
jgi:hypothetical protein